MSTRSATILFTAVIAVRATSFLFSKMLLLDMGPFSLLALRFLLAFVLLALIFHRKLRAMTRPEFMRGLVLGALFFVVMALEMFALTMAASSTVAFLENTAIVFVPLFTAVISRKLPTVKAVVCTLVVMVGVGLLTLGDTAVTFGAGEALALCCAVLYAVVIIVTARFSRSGDATCLGVLQVGFIGLFGAIAALLLEQPVLPSGPVQWAYLVFIVVVCTGFGFTFQPMAQRYITEERAGMLLAASPLVGGIVGVLAGGEPFGPGMALGAALIIGGIVATSFEGRKGGGKPAADGTPKR